MTLLSIQGSLYAAAIWLCSGLYKVAAFVFKIFLILSRGNIISADDYQLIITNFYVVLGIVMLFIISFAFLRGMVNPDDQKQGTSIVKKTIINLVTSVFMIAILPTAFSFLYDVQDSIINYNTIGTFFGYGTFGEDGPEFAGPTTNPEMIALEEYSANQIVNGIWTAFFHVDPDWCDSEISDQDSIDIDTNNPAERIEWCNNHIEAEEPSLSLNGYLKSFTSVSNYVESTAKFNVYNSFSENAAADQIEFLWGMSLIAGAYLIYVALNFCFDMGLRLIKLIFYQVIAPIPILLRIVPYGKLSSTFNQWVKVTLTCYFEVFVRIFVFYFAIYICVAIRTSEKLASIMSNFGFFTIALTYAFLYMGVLTFMKKSPKIVSDVMGIDSGNMKLGLKDKFKEAMSAVPGLGVATTLAKKTVAGVDAMASGQKFMDGWRRIEGKGPISAVKKWFGGMLPYTAQTMENRRKADEQLAALEDRKKQNEKARKNFKKIFDGASSRVKDELLNEYEINENGEKVFKRRKDFNELESGDYIKLLGLTNRSQYGKLADTYAERGTAKKRMLDAEAEYNAAKQSGDSVAIGQAAKKYNEFKDSYDAIDNEWKQMLNSSKYKDVQEKFSAMKYMEDRGKGIKDFDSNSRPDLANDTSERGGYQANRNNAPGSQPNTTRVPVRPVGSGTSATPSTPTIEVAPSYAGPRGKSNGEIMTDNVNRAIDEQKRKNLIEQWEKAPIGSQERKDIERQIQEIEHRY